MPINEQETVASLKLLVAMAKADGELAPEESETFAQSLGGAGLPAGLTAGALLAGSYDVDQLVGEIRSTEAREAAFSACFSMAYADRKVHPAEQALLEKLEKAWTVPPAKKGLLGRIFSETWDTLSLTSIQPIADPARRKAQVDEDVLKYSILSGVLGANPVPIGSLATDMAVVGLQMKMFRDVGQYWGRETSKDAVKQLFAGLGVGTGARIALTNLMKFIPVAGSVAGAATSFASTWALGKVANQYWESGGKADLKMLRELFKTSQAEGKREYEARKAEVEAAKAQRKSTLDQLAADYAAGKISEADYERSVAELK